MRPVARLLQEREGQRAASAGPCFAPLFGNAALSDLDVILQEEQPLQQGATTPTAQQQAVSMSTPAYPHARIPANAAVLYSLSEFVRNKVDNWSDEQQQGERRQLLLLVPPGQLCTGRLLVEAMYMDAPDLSHLGLGELLQLLALADSYSVPKVVGFAAAALAEVAADGPLPWEGLLAVLNLPEACLVLPGCEEMRVAAVKQLQQELGDLEAVWNSTEKSEQLLALPLTALKQLLADDATAADSEDTVVYTIQRWLQQRHTDMETVPEEDMDELTPVVRLADCSATYIGSAAADDAHWLSWGYNSAELAIACCLASNPPESAVRQSQWTRRYPAWALPVRPTSSSNTEAGVLELDWELPFSKAWELCIQCLDKKCGKEVLLDGSEVRVWRGRRWGLQAAFHHKGIGLYVTLRQDTADALSMVSANVAAKRGYYTPWRNNYDPVVVEGTWGRVGDSSVIYYTSSQQRSWMAIEGMLADCGFLHNSGEEGRGQVLRLVAQVTAVK